MNSLRARSESVARLTIRQCLMSHAQETASRALDRLGGPLSLDNLDAFLMDSDCVKYRAQIVFDSTPLEPRQFALPVFHGGSSQRVCKLYVHPYFASAREYLPLIVAYMAGAINFGGSVPLSFCEMYGAALMQMPQEDFYDAIRAVTRLVPSQHAYAH
ncbi:MAG: hypothetical protein IT367_16645 [Candidatus Hydrogenedentes bacterium]|nr:hypothetical protein [Candidatus Hydrogenedentota bacterium]